jgi:hypothetical protein
MGTWNYRLCKETAREHDGEPVIYYSLREAYYNADGEIWAVTEGEASVGFDQYPFENFDPVKEAERTFDRMRQALDRPIVDLDTIVFADSGVDMDDASEVIDNIDDLDLDNG